MPPEPETSATGRVRLAPTDDEARWDALVTSLPGGTAFHRYAWLRHQCDLLGFRFVPLLATSGASGPTSARSPA